MDDSSWNAPPGAAQPTGIQSTAGAVPIMNEKGEVSMKKVKVQRYVSGKRPEYAPDSSDEEISDDEDFTRPQTGGPPSPTHYKRLTDVEMQDPRLRRLLTSTKSAAPRRESDDEGYADDVREKPVGATEDDLDAEKGEEEGGEDTVTLLERRRVVQSEVVESEDDDKEDGAEKDAPAMVWPSHRLADSDSESEAEMDEEEMANRRQRLKEKAMLKAQQEEEEILGKEDEGSEESSEEESSEYTDESDSEEEGPRLKPVFVRKKDRVTIIQKDAQQNKAKHQEVENRRRQEERRRDTLRMIESENRNAAAANAANQGDPSLEDINTDDEADDAEYESWKTRELRRLKRDKEEKEAFEKEKEDTDRRRNMTEEERRIELRNNPKTVTNKAAKGKYKFLQKYYHRGVFFLDEEDEVYKRDFSGATLEDHFDKTVLPQVMQVKNFGRSGRTKYTHLVDQDTTSFDSPWASDSQMNHKFYSSSAGGMKQPQEKPSTKKRSEKNSSSSSSNRK